ncbi:minor tail protein [Mycobacterium phage Tonenili]|uniref:Minor tail protein n=1 Tax=Mycobacterium phage Tonenili TaxID=1891703 RepID=A0A1C9EHC9_9CAUD|nr:minor tail protein [Mycobacterium phage Tonenili]AON96897.1 minor tail protein [Mycobacterium phage Tonenili]
MTIEGYVRNAGATQREPAVVHALDLPTRTATVLLRSGYTVRVNCAYAVGDAIITPAIGEQWYVERFDMEWRLAGRIPFNDPTQNIEPEAGQVSLGSASGPLELNGVEIRVNGMFRLGMTFFRPDATGKLQYSQDGVTWVPVVPPAGPGAPASTDEVPEGATNKYYTDERAAAAAPVKTVATRTGHIVLTKDDVGLSNVDNTSDNAKPISSATASALALKADLVSGKVPASQLPIPPVAEYPDMSSFPAPGVAGTLYIAADTGNLYRWDSVAANFELIVSATGGGAASTDELPEGSTNLYYTGSRVTALIQSMFGSAAGEVTEGNDPRLSDTRTPTDDTVTTPKIVDRAVTTDKIDDEAVTMDKLAEDVQLALDESAYDVSYPQTLGQRAVGYGQNTIGVKLQRPVTFSKITYRCGTADGGGTATFELHRNGVAVPGTQATISAASQVEGTTVTGEWPFAEGDILKVYTSLLGTAPIGVGLVADLKGKS